MVTGIVVASVVIALVALVVLMRWADKRDRAKGHVNRGFGEIRSTLRSDRSNIRNLRRRGSYGAVSPHKLRDQERRHR